MPKDSFTFNLNSPTFHADAIRQALEQLMSLRNSTKKRAELEWEIRVYRWILHQPDPEATALQYFEARDTGTMIPADKREAIARLGWSIP